MRKCFLSFALLCFLAANSQERITKKELQVFQKNREAHPLLAADDADFTISKSSGRWKDESAVILCQKTTFDFDKKGLSIGQRVGRNVVGLLLALPTLGTSIYHANRLNDTQILVEEKERRKILLKDKYALDLYSLLYFRLSNEGDAFDARVIKRDGSIQKISIEDAVKVDNLRQVPDVFRSYTDDPWSSTYRPTYFKVVVPDLQEGDILEYEFVNYNIKNYLYNPEFKEFSPVYYLCNRSMPVEKQIIEVAMQDEKYHLGYKSLQGAPQFVPATAKGRQVYRWEDVGRDKVAEIRYLNKNLELPSVKFQVIYAKRRNNGFMFVHDQQDAGKDLSEAEFSEKAKMFWFAGDNSAIPAEWKFDFGDQVRSVYKAMKKRSQTEGSNEDFVRKAYYTIRGKTLYQNWGDYAFAKVFAGLLDKKGIPYEVVATSSNQQTDMAHLAFAKEIVWAIKYNNRYYSNPYEHLNPGEVPLWLNGNRSVTFGSDAKSEAKPLRLPQSDTAANSILHNIKVSLGSDNTQMLVDEGRQATGLVKNSLIDDVLALTPFMEMDHRNYDGGSMFEELGSRERTAAEEAFTAQKKEWKEEKPKMMKALLEEEYDKEVIGDVVFRVTNDGRTFKKPALIYHQKYTLGGMVAKAGPDLVLSLPLLIGNQSQIKKEERQRQTPAHLAYARSMQWNISFTIPAGYSVQGIEKLNQSVRNEAGSFVSTALVQGSELVLQVKKTYNTAYLEASRWPLLLQMLDAAFNWSQSKVILKKGE